MIKVLVSSTESFGQELTQVKILIAYQFRNNHRRRSVKEVFLEISQNSQENTCANFIKKESLAQVFSCEFCEISKNTFFKEHLWTTASVNW